jgi:predicted nucleic acid-binding protein
VALAWVVDNPVSPYAVQVKAEMLKGKRAVVPALWHLEVANGLAMTERRGDLTLDEVTAAVDELQIIASQSIDTETALLPLREALAGARAHGLTSYDAVYLELALQEGLPLATLDKRLRAAATKAGVALF